MDRRLKRLVLDRIDASGDCWIWTGTLDRKGYGAITYEGTTYRGHRLVWEMLVGALGDLHIDHLCRNRPCVNPDHLEPVTNRENFNRSYATEAARRREATHCDRGHPFTPENTVWRTDSPGHRRCRTCDRIRKREWQRQRRSRGAA